MEVIPAIDIRGGRCVRLVQGDYERETVFSDDPVAMAQRWVREGAGRIHVVDLDGARDGRLVNDDDVRRIIEAADVPVQVAGGVRTLGAIETWLAAGADRVVLGTAVVRDPGLVEEAARLHGDRVVVSIDARDGLFAADGWREVTDQRADDLLRRFAGLGVQRFVFTDIAVDGTLSAPNFEAIEMMVRATPAKVIASGGIADVAHLTRLAQIGADGAILGRALYDGQVDLSEALRAAAPASGGES
jgi:phosphoribosylformimino-5-aminoimidazole carboxamide ribotide isomerase